jgi:hypothetical protein
MLQMSRILGGYCPDAYTPGGVHGNKSDRYVWDEIKSAAKSGFMTSIPSLIG